MKLHPSIMHHLGSFCNNKAEPVGDQDGCRAANAKARRTIFGSAAGKRLGRTSGVSSSGNGRSVQCLLAGVDKVRNSTKNGHGARRIEATGPALLASGSASSHAHSAKSCCTEPHGRRTEDGERVKREKQVGPARGGRSLEVDYPG